MIKVFATGNIGKDAEVKNFGENNVTTFSIASTKKIKGENKTTWLNCQKWNSEKLAPYLKKGIRVELSGDLEIREHDGKYYTTLNVYELEFGSKPVQNEGMTTGTSLVPDLPESDIKASDYDKSQEQDLPF